MNIKTGIAVVIALLVVGVFGYLTFFNSMQSELPPTEEQVVETADGVTNEKIDINAVCEGALAYMSFPDGASAELFVSDCKEGKHPEVIEKFKADMNISADIAI